MHVVVDANILVGQLSRDQGRRVLRHPRLQLLITEQVWSEVWHEFPRRLQRRVAAQTFSGEAIESTLSVTHQIAEEYITRIPPEIYALYEDEARLRIPDDPDDWPTVALALATKRVSGQKIRTSSAVMSQSGALHRCGQSWKARRKRLPNNRPNDTISAEVAEMHWTLAERHWFSRIHAQGFWLAAYPPLVLGYAAG